MGPTESEQAGVPRLGPIQQTVKDVIASVPQNMISNLYKSLKRRMELVTEKQAGLTGY